MAIYINQQMSVEAIQWPKNNVVSNEILEWLYKKTFLVNADDDLIFHAEGKRLYVAKGDYLVETPSGYVRLDESAFNALFTKVAS